MSDMKSKSELVDKHREIKTRKGGRVERKVRTNSYLVCCALSPPLSLSLSLVKDFSRQYLSISISLRTKSNELTMDYDEIEL
jgi:hypothetical protein